MAFVNLISAYVLLGNMLVAKGILFQIKSRFQSELDLMSSLVNLYVKCGDLEAAQQVFRRTSLEECSVANFNDKWIC